MKDLSKEVREDFEYLVSYAQTAEEKERLWSVLTNTLSRVRAATLQEAIEAVGTHTEKNGSYCDTGEDMEWGCRSKCVEMALTRLSALKLKV